MPKDYSARYYQKNKEKLQKRARERCQNFLNDKKEKQNTRERYKNLPKHKKQKQLECRIEYYKLWKNKSASQ